MVEAVPPVFGGGLIVALVAVAQAAGQALGDVDADLAGLTGLHILAVGVQQVHIVQGHRLTHGAQLVAGAVDVADDEGTFGLTEALHDGQARGGLELLVNLGVQGLTGGGGVLDGAQVEAAQVLLRQHPVHGGGRAEGGDAVLADHWQDLLRIKAVKVVDENRSLTQPLTVDLAPAGLGPAGVGDGQVQAVGIDPVPVFGGDEVAQGIFIIVCRQLGVAGGAGGEEHQHGVRAAGGILAPLKTAGEEGVLLIEIMPALPGAVHQDLMLHTGALCRGGIHSVRHIAVGGAEDGLDLARLEAVGEVLFQELIGGGDGHRAQLVQAQHAEPVLVVPLQHQHHPVAPADAQGLEVVGGSCGFLLHVLEGEPPLGHVLGNVEHGHLVGLLGAQGVDDVEGEVELLLTLEGNARQDAALGGGVDEFAVNSRLLVGSPPLGLGDLHGRGLLALTGGGVRQDEGVEGAVLAADGDHAVGGGGIIVDGVTGVQDLGPSADLDLHLAPDDDVALLALMGDQLDVLILGTGAVLHLHVQGQGDAVAEIGGQVVADHVVGLLDAPALALTGQVVAAQLGAPALQQVTHINAEAQGAAIEEGDAQIPGTGLAVHVFLDGQIRPSCHLLDGEAGDLTQLPDTGRHFPYLEIHAGHCLFHRFSLLSVDNEKSSSQRNDSLRRAKNIPAVPLKLHHPHGRYPSSGSSKP